MLKKSCLAAVALILSQTSVAKTAVQPTASSVINSASAQEWRIVDADNILKITLPTGSAYIELNPLLAPKHAENIKQLARDGFYKGLSVYRFVEGFVAQGGDASGKKSIKNASKSLPAEFYLTTATALNITELDITDGYAPLTGFLKGFAVAQNEAQTQTWQVHCNGVFAMARDNNINSGGTEFYVTIGHGPRYLDRNITVFGRVLEGMEHFNRLSRTPIEGELFNPIADIHVLADIAKHDTSQFKVLKTDSNAFKSLIKARQNRSEEWFVETPDYVDVCGMPIPTKRLKS